MAVVAGKQVSQVVCAATGGTPPWGALSWLAPPPLTILPPYLTLLAQVSLPTFASYCDLSVVPLRYISPLLLSDLT